MILKHDIESCDYHMTSSHTSNNLRVWHGNWNLPCFVQINFYIGVWLLTETKYLQRICMQPEDYVLKQGREEKRREKKRREEKREIENTEE